MEAQTTARNPQVMSRLQIVFLTWRRYVASRFAPHGVTLKQVFVLRRLTESEYLLPSQIASMLFCDRPTATVVVKNMERQGWVRRERDTADKRQKRVILTETGRTKMAALQEQVWAPLEADVDPLACFDEGEIAVLNELLGRLARHVRGISSDTEE
jgi:DNA-binding MarR family transcriptional regulator